MLTRLLTCLMLLVLTACAPRYEDFYVCNDYGQPKPKVAFFPVMASCSSDMDAQEVTTGIRQNLMATGNLYVYPEDSINQVVEYLGNVNYFGRDFAFTKHIRPSEYAVIVEIVDSHQFPYLREHRCLFQSNMKPCEGDQVLEMKARIRILDLRGESPRPILQELYRCHYLIPRPINALFTVGDYEVYHRQNAKNQFVQGLSSRIEAYILESH